MTSAVWKAIKGNGNFYVMYNNLCIHSTMFNFQIKWMYNFALFLKHGSRFQEENKNWLTNGGLRSAKD